jgi:hypothetical protein
MFASKTVTEHILRGAVGCGAFGTAVALSAAHPLLALTMAWGSCKPSAQNCSARRPRTLASTAAVTLSLDLTELGVQLPIIARTSSSLKI